MKLLAKTLPPHLLQHLKSVHAFTGVTIGVRDGREVSAEPDADSSHIISVFDMELGTVQRADVGRANFFALTRSEMMYALAQNRRTLLIGDNQVGVYSTHTYGGRAYIDLRMDKQTLALYFDLSHLQAAQGLPDVEKLMLLILANERDKRRAEAAQALFVHSKIQWAAVTDELMEKKLVTYHGAAIKGINSVRMTAAGRTVVSNISAAEHRTLYRRFLGDYY